MDGLTLHPMLTEVSFVPGTSVIPIVSSTTFVNCGVNRDRYPRGRRVVLGLLSQWTCDQPSCSARGESFWVWEADRARMSIDRARATQAKTRAEFFENYDA